MKRYGVEGLSMLKSWGLYKCLVIIIWCHSARSEESTDVGTVLVPVRGQPQGLSLQSNRMTLHRGVASDRFG